MFIVVMMHETGWLSTYLEIVVVIPEHTGGTIRTYWGYYQNILGVLPEHVGGTTRMYNILYENTIIIVPPRNIYYTFIAVIGKEIGWLATYLEIVVVLS